MREGFSSLLKLILVLASLYWPTLEAQTSTVPKEDHSFIDGSGTAHITRVVPVPKTVSPEAQKMLARPASDVEKPQSLDERRRGTDEWQNRTGLQFERQYSVKIQPGAMAGIPIRTITPSDWPENKREHLLINLHGGGFNSDSGSLTETVPVAALSKTKVVAVLYRLAPEHPFPAAVQDFIAVYREALRTYKPENIGVFGTSAGAILTGEVAVNIRSLNLPMPGVLGIFSGFGDFARLGDSISLFSLGGLSGPLAPPAPSGHRDTAYTGNTRLQDPVLSPMYADLQHFPPTLFITSTRDLLLSGTVELHRAFLRAGNEAQLAVFDGLPHAFWNNPDLPETKEADLLMASFLDGHLQNHKPKR